MFRRQPWMKWLPPMAARSPSPVKTTTLRFGFAILTPVANAMARPWVVWSESVRMYPGARDEQPIPETKTVSSFFQPIWSIAASVQLMIVPFPQTGTVDMGEPVLPVPVLKRHGWASSAETRSAGV